MTFEGEVTTLFIVVSESTTHLLVLTDVPLNSSSKTSL